MDCISKYIDVTEVDHGNRTRFIMNFKYEAYSSPELRNRDNFWVINGKMSHCSGCTLDTDDESIVKNSGLYSKLRSSPIVIDLHK